MNIMHKRFSGASLTATVAAVASIISVSLDQTQAQSPAGTNSPPVPALKTPWGEPNLQGIWTDENDTPLQRPARYANQEFFTPQQRAELDKLRVDLLNRERPERGTARDVAGAYNSAFVSFKRTGERTSLIVDPPNGQMPPLTAEARKIAAAERDFRLALIAATDTCMVKEPACNGGTYNPAPSARFNEPPPRYNTGTINRHDGPEDGNLANRCLTGGLPEFGNRTGSYRRIVQTPGGIAMFYDVGQGQGWQRNIVMDGSPHVPSNIRLWYGDSRGRWEGDTLVVDVTNFSAKTDYQGGRENLHLVERWTRTSPTKILYEVRIEDPTVWTAPWTVKEEFALQSNEENRFYTEPRCVDSNYGLAGLLHGRRVEERLFREGKGPDPRTIDNVKAGFLLADDPVR
jgi:hypothetical protein